MDGIIKDFFDGQAYKQLLQEWQQLKEDPRNMMLALITDGVQPFKDDKGYSIWPIAIMPLNVPPTLRASLTSIMCIVPGTRMLEDDEGPLDLNPYLEVLVDELWWLDRQGVIVEDASKPPSDEQLQQDPSARGERFRCYARLVQVRRRYSLAECEVMKHVSTWQLDISVMIALGGNDEEDKGCTCI